MQKQETSLNGPPAGIVPFVVRDVLPFPEYYGLSMQNDVLKKLTGALVQPIRSEMQVVYILVETRKVLELEDPKRTDYEALRFHCDWAMHVRMSWNPVAIELVTRLNDFERLAAQVNANGGVMPHVANLQDIFDAAVQLVGRLRFINLQAQLGKFLIGHDLPHEPVSDKRWPDFIRHYVGVVRDVPLIAKAKGNKLDYVDQVQLQVVDAPMTNCTVAVEWSYVLKQPPCATRILPQRF